MEVGMKSPEKRSLPRFRIGLSDQRASFGPLKRTTATRGHVNLKAIRSFAVRAALPEPLGALHGIANNLRWSWDQSAVDLFRWVDEEKWERAGHDPARMLGLVSRDRYRELVEDGPFMAFLQSVAADLDRYLREPRWYQVHKGDEPGIQVAYFSPEFAVTEALPTYSGGLGVLAGGPLTTGRGPGSPGVGGGLF